MVIITGHHRSGTTFVGKLIESSDCYHNIHEPFNKDYGICGVEKWYPYYSSFKDLQLTNLLSHLLNEKLKFRVPKKPFKDGYLKGFGRLFLRSKGNLDYLRYRLIKSHKEIVYKDPFLSLCSNYLMDNKSDIKVIYVVRHPVAVYKSIKRMNWDFDFDNILAQQSLVDELSANFLENATFEERFCSLWSIINLKILEHHKENPNKSLIIKHEDLSIDPFETVSKIFKFLGGNMNKKTTDFIHSNMIKGKVNPQNKKQHNFVRNSSELAYSWKNELDCYDNLILENTKIVRGLFNYD